MAALAALSPGCAGAGTPADDPARADSVARARQDSINRARPGYVVDSILPIDEELRRFRAGLPAVAAFEGGASSPTQLADAVVRALAAADTSALVRLAVTRAEFAWLVYPESPYTAPPYRQAPGLVWMRQDGASRIGLARLLARYGGTAAGRAAVSCTEPPAVEGRNRIWRDCAIRLGRGGQAITAQLFGAVIERDGQFKILSFANDL